MTNTLQDDFRNKIMLDVLHDTNASGRHIEALVTLINSEVTSVLDELIAQQWSFDDKDDALAVPTRYIQSIRSRYE